MPSGGKSACYLSITKGGIFCAKGKQKVKVTVSRIFQAKACVRIYTHIYMCIYVHTHAHTHTHKNVCLFVFFKKCFPKEILK